MYTSLAMHVSLSAATGHANDIVPIDIASDKTVIHMHPTTKTRVDGADCIAIAGDYNPLFVVYIGPMLQSHRFTTTPSCRSESIADQS